MPDEKLLTFYTYAHAVGAKILLGGMDKLLAYIKTYAEELSDGDEHELEFGRHDMTQAEIDAVPEEVL